MVTPSFFGYMLSPVIRVAKAFFVLTFSSRAGKGAGIDFVAFGGDTYQTLESNVQTFIDKEITLLKNNITVPFNSSNNVLEVTVRDDFFDVPNSKITVPASTTGKFSSGDISEIIIAGSLIDEKLNRVGSGNLTDLNILAEFEK